MMSAARPNSGGPNGMSQSMLLFLAGLGFQHFTKSLDQLRGGKDKGGDKKSQAGSLLQTLAASRAMPQGAMTPGGDGGMPPMLAGGSGPGFIALLARLAAAANRGSTT